MQFPITRYQLLAAIQVYGFRPDEAERIVTALELEGRVELSGSMLYIHNPTDADAMVIAGLCRKARGASPGHVGIYRIKEYLDGVLHRANVHGVSVRV
jgi:hypothetical protein